MTRDCGAGEFLATIADNECAPGVRVCAGEPAMMAAQRSCNFPHCVRAFCPVGPFPNDAEALTAHAAVRLRSLLADLAKYLHSPDLAFASQREDMDESLSN